MGIGHSQVERRSCTRDSPGALSLLPLLVPLRVMPLGEGPGSGCLQPCPVCRHAQTDQRGSTAPAFGGGAAEPEPISPWPVSHEPLQLVGQSHLICSLKVFSD